MEPAVQELSDLMHSLEKTYLVYKGRIMQKVVHNVALVPDIKGRLMKIKKYVDDIMKNV
jgi:RNA-metabolizing metallo-beta-lactamase